MSYKYSDFDCDKISRQLDNQNVLIEFVVNSPTFNLQGCFAKGKLHYQGLKRALHIISITLKINNTDIDVPCEDIKTIIPL
jgi:hypothetical protein